MIPVRFRGARASSKFFTLVPAKRADGRGKKRGGEEEIHQIEMMGGESRAAIGRVINIA